MPAVAKLRVDLNGAEVKTDDLHAVTVNLDIDQPDEALVVLNNKQTKYSQTVNQGEELVVKVGDTSDVLFTGEVTTLEPVWDMGDETRVTVRGYSRLHRLTRGLKSRIFQKVTDGDIVKKVAQDHGLTPEVKQADAKRDHVYQHNETDLKFLLHLAARTNHEIVVGGKDGKTLIYRPRDLSQDTGQTLVFGASDATSVERFRARLSSAGQVKEVRVHAWNPVEHKTVIGKATAAVKVLGGKEGSSSLTKFGSDIYHYDVDIPVRSVDHANAVAKAKLDELLLNYITGEAQCQGNPALKAGKLVTLDLSDTRFGGKYYIAGLSHRYYTKGKSGPDAGYLTFIKVRRNAEGT